MEVERKKLQESFDLTPKRKMVENARKSGNKRSPLIKSPSDTTLYTPAFKVVNDNSKIADKNGMVNNITNFIQTVRVSQESSEVGGQIGPDQGDHDQPRPSTSQCDKEELQELIIARQRAEKTILDAEKFHATVSAPNPGENIGQFGKLSEESGQGIGLTDDDFFHITCHVNQNLLDKIEKGDFVDLEKLLPKDKGFQGNHSENS